MKISAVIFDLNGTILEDEDEYGTAFNKVLESLGIKTGEKYPHISGIGVKENWVEFKSKYKLMRSIEELTKETQEAYLQELDAVTLRPGFEEFARSLKESGIRIALATSNSREVTSKILEKVGLDGLFDVITTSEEVKYNKPAPELFTLTADKLGGERYNCLVIEDAPLGVAAAHRAGMKVVAIARDEKYAKQLKEADLIVGGFSEITSREIDRL